MPSPLAGCLLCLAGVRMSRMLEGLLTGVGFSATEHFRNNNTDIIASTVNTTLKMKRNTIKSHWRFIEQDSGDTWWPGKPLTSAPAGPGSSCPSSSSPSCLGAPARAQLSPEASTGSPHCPLHAGAHPIGMTLVPLRPLPPNLSPFPSVCFSCPLPAPSPVGFLQEACLTAPAFPALSLCSTSRLGLPMLLGHSRRPQHSHHLLCACHVQDPALSTPAPTQFFPQHSPVVGATVTIL